MQPVIPANITARAWILYDGECPFCANTFQYLQLRKNIGAIELLDARQGGAELAYVTASGFDINEGTAFMYQGELFVGDQVLHKIASLTDAQSNVGFVAWVNRLINSNYAVAKAIYPTLRAIRGLTIRLMGKDLRI